jgi:hypothetical protein
MHDAENHNTQREAHMTRIAAPLMLSLLLASCVLKTDVATASDNPNFLVLDEDLVTLCASWMRGHKGLPLSNQQIFESGLCQGYLTAALRLTIERECAMYVTNRTPGWSISAAIEAVNRLWYANSKDYVFRTSSPEHIIDLVVNEVLGPKETREAKCQSADLGRLP